MVRRKTSQTRVSSTRGGLSNSSPASCLAPVSSHGHTRPHPATPYCHTIWRPLFAEDMCPYDRNNRTNMRTKTKTPQPGHNLASVEVCFRAIRRKFGLCLEKYSCQIDRLKLMTCLVNRPSPLCGRPRYGETRSVPKVSNREREHIEATNLAVVKRVAEALQHPSDGSNSAKDGCRPRMTREHLDRLDESRGSSAREFVSRG